MASLIVVARRRSAVFPTKHFSGSTRTETNLIATLWVVISYTEFCQFEYKLATIEPLLKSWRERRFILIGDTGEKDPEVYGELARRHPAQIERIWLRNVTNDQPDAPRYRQALRDLPSSQWRLFVDGTELSR